MREIIIFLGLIAISLIIWDGLRRMKAANKKADDDYQDPEELARKAQIARELPNGGARVRKQKKAATPAPENTDTNTEAHTATNKSLTRLNLQERVPMLMERIELDDEAEQASTEATADTEQAELDFGAQLSIDDIDEQPVSLSSNQPTNAELESIEAELLPEEQEQSEPEQIEPEFDESGLAESEFEDKDLTEPASEEPESQPATAISAEQAEAGLESAEELEPVEDLVIMHVMAKQGQELSGSEILELLLASGLRHGPMGIFHYRNPKGQTEFSLANCVHPGTFNPDAMSQLNTPGITLFLQLPSRANSMEAFEHMYQMGTYLAKKLDADLLDEEHSTVTAQRCEYYREKLRAFARSKLLPD
ncbi:cell division protein ZipA [Reinekea thalattae]|uniref:Cell division protein ZipA n=1 Tax=Reinekea thalattae TaxID=2593301 RepID=A0A5C8Z908_9GAMM|nr:cell division protein ZipA [Reinekea thalattae]TXR53723.1 cell division protein ZipA [Reinekea thalattae]